MKICELKPPRGAKHKNKRRGRGTGSGHGKTSCRGHKGQKSRSGTKRRFAFEGGQMPIARRLPKRGFRSKFKKVFQVVNVEDLNAFRKDAVVKPQQLVESGFIKNEKLPVKILGNGEIKKPLTVLAHGFTKSATKKLNAVGGKFELIKC